MHTLRNEGFLVWPVGIGKQAEQRKRTAGCAALFAEAICYWNYAPFFLHEHNYVEVLNITVVDSTMVPVANLTASWQQ
jgi:hypothetical protein